MEYPFKDLLPLDEVLAREGYYKDWTHLDPEVFYSLTQISNFIKTKGYGVDVRLLIAQLAEHFGLKTTQVVDLGNLLQQKFTNLEGVTQSFTNNINSLVEQMEADKDAVIANATVDSEVILARGGKPTLQARLDDTTAQLAHNAQVVNDAVSKVTVDSEVILSRDGHTTLNARLDSEKAEFSTHKAEIEKIIDVENNNLFNGNTLFGSVSKDDGTIFNPADTSRLHTGFIPINPNKTIFNNYLDIVTPGTITTQTFVFFDENYGYVGYIDQAVNTVTPPANARYLKQNLKSSTFSVNPKNYYLMQEEQLYTSKLNSVDSIQAVLNVKDSKLNDGTFFQGSIDATNGNLILTTDVNRKASGFIPIDSSKIVKMNWLELVIPSQASHTIIFYDVNKSYIKSVDSTVDEVAPPINAHYMRQNLSTSNFMVDLNQYKVFQYDLPYSPTIETIKEQIEDINKLKTFENNVSDFEGYDLSTLQMTAKNTVYVYDFLSAGLTDSQVISQCLNFSSILKNRLIIFDRKDWLIDEAILLDSNTTVIVDNCKIKQNDYVFDNVFRGNNLIINPSNPDHYPLSVSPISNIKIIAKGTGVIEGCDNNVTKTHPILGDQLAVGDYWGWRTLLISLSKCTNFEVSGLKFEKTRCWAVSVDKCAHGIFRDNNFNSTVKNGDGIDIRSGCHDIIIDGVTGNTSDDSVAMTAIDFQPTGNYVYPMEPSKIEDGSYTMDELSIYNISVNNVLTGGEAHGVICLASGGRRVFDVSITDVIETLPSSRESVIKIYTGYGGGYKDNDLHNIRINNVVSKGAGHAIKTVGKVDNVWFNKIRQEKISGGISDIDIPTGITITNATKL